jgi:RNA polymerase sigma factor (TIGR02999 family)
LAGDRPGDITLLLRRVGAGDDAAQEALYVKVCEQLRDLAKGFVRGQPANGTLGATALVNEAYLRLAAGPEGGWNNRRHFFGVAARAMRSVLVDHARRKRAVKRGGDAEREPLDGLAAPFEEQADILDLNDALEGSRNLRITKRIRRLRSLLPRAAPLAVTPYPC